MKKVLVFIFYLVTSSGVFATGWNDYELDIGDGYSIVRANTFDVMLVRNKRIIVSNHNYGNIGPITHYHKNAKFILLRTAGWKPRSLFEGDEFKKIDSTKTYYFVVKVTDGSVQGPLLGEAFLMHESVISVGNFDWIRPTNPNFWLPLAGTLYFVLLSIPILYVMHWYLTVPITLLVIYWLLKRSRRRRDSQIWGTVKGDA
ncbi:MAG: hypothetical protein ACYS76_08630 [Planctomycetota bacterium]|jgi:hypothetical protein